MPGGAAPRRGAQPHAPDRPHMRCCSESAGSRQGRAWRPAALGPGCAGTPPGGVHVRRCRPGPPGAQDPPGRFADPVSEPGHLAVHPAVSPGGVLPRQPQCRVADLPASARAARPVRVCPLAGDQAAVPGRRYRRRRDTNRDPAPALLIWPNHRSQPLRRVLKQYRAGAVTASSAGASRAGTRTAPATPTSACTAPVRAGSRGRVVLGDRKWMRNVPESGWRTR